jgi:hypothetical protein
VRWLVVVLVAVANIVGAISVVSTQIIVWLMDALKSTNFGDLSFTTSSSTSRDCVARRRAGWRGASGRSSA